jgi:hypothetical protein
MGQDRQKAKLTIADDILIILILLIVPMWVLSASGILRIG